MQVSTNRRDVRNKSMSGMIIKIEVNIEKHIITITASATNTDRKDSIMKTVLLNLLKDSTFLMENRVMIMDRMKHII